MIIGNYPCCNGTLTIAVPEKTPVWFSEECPHCGVAVWHRVSRVDPELWTVEEFEKIFDIDREARVITRKDGTDTEIRVKPEGVE